MSYHGRTTLNTRPSRLANEPPQKDQHVPEIAGTETSRPVCAGTGKQRGNTPRKDVTTRVS